MPRRLLIGILVLVFLVAVFAGPLATLYTEFLWFSSLGYLQAFWVGFLSRLGLGFSVGLAVFLFLFGNLLIAKRAVGRGITSVRGIIDVSDFPLEKRLTLVFLGISLVIGLFAGFGASSYWASAQEFINSVPFGVEDPVFGKDTGFYVFRLPFMRYAYSTAMFILVLSLLACGAIYVISGSVRFRRWRLEYTSQTRYHLSILIALAFLGLALGYRLSMYRLLYSPTGVVFGAGYTDIAARLPAYRVLFFISIGVALISILNCVIRADRIALAGVGALILVSFLVGVLYPAAVQRFIVEPNETSKEKPFITYNIEFTRKAYGLDGIEERFIDVKDEPDREDLIKGRDTLRNIRLWDWRPLQQTYSQLQEIRLYYRFRDVDLDRYRINGELRQVALSGRELALEEVPAQARTWVNDHLKYTHGYGLCMSPVNEISPEGLPQFVIRDIPPESTPDIPVARPEIYFGEETGQYVIVKARSPEFDYPMGDQNAYATYQGKGGVRLSSIWRRLAFALRFGSSKLLLSRDITGESRVLFRRNIRERVRRIAPFLQYDGDPYLVVADGRLFWIWDAYTTTSRYPYSTPHRKGFNYIRNPVKVVVDAYDGAVKFYLIDETEPIARVYSRIFKGLFSPYSTMPDSLKEHIRYPEDMFLVQAEMLSTYHMTDSTVFYNKEDYWDIPSEVYGGTEQKVQPYYAVMKPPGEDRLKFLVMIPFTPIKKSNMIAWLFADCDEPDYGRMVLYKFPKQRLIYGPMQIESRIDQDAEISQMLTLWGQKGSRTVRGNLIVAPIGDSIIYVEPLYILAEKSELPELKRVIVATPTRVAMDVSFEAALARATGADLTGLGLGPALRASEAPSPMETGLRPQGIGVSSEASRLIDEALRLYGKAEERLKAGDWAGYGTAISELGKVLRRLREESNR